MKSVVKYYTKQKSSVYTCFLDAAEAFDRVSFWTLLSKLIKQNILLVIVTRIISLWCQIQPMCMKRGKISSTYFNVLNDVSQGGVLSPKMFSIYVDDVLLDLDVCKSRCYINDQCINHVMCGL